MKKGEIMEKKTKQPADVQEGKVQADKRLLNVEIVLGNIVTVSFLTILGLSCYIMAKLNVYVMPAIFIIVSVAIFVVGVVFCLLIEQKAGYYECDKCHHKYVPTFSQTLWSMHMGRTRYMKCPHCHQKSWNKKVLK